MQIRSGEARQVINRLHRLRRKISQTGTQGFKSRVEFLCLAFRHELDADIRHYRLWDEGWEDLGERQWDTCFEMGDAPLVIGEVMRQARQHGFVESIKRYCNLPGAFERWQACANQQAELF